MGDLAIEHAIEHVINFAPSGWTLTHPFVCSLLPSLDSCHMTHEVTVAALRWAGPPNNTFGDYIVRLEPSGRLWFDLLAAQ